MSIKISFMHYMKWTRVMLPVVFKEFEMVFFATFVFSPSLPIGKRSTLAKMPIIPFPSVSMELLSIHYLIADLH